MTLGEPHETCEVYYPRYQFRIDAIAPHRALSKGLNYNDWLARALS